MQILPNRRSVHLAASILLVALGTAGAPAQLLGPEFQVNSYTFGTQAHPTVALASSAAFVVAWDSYGADGSAQAICAQRFDASGAPFGTEMVANTYVTSGQQHPALGADRWGNFVIVWDSYLQDGSSFGIFAQRFAAGGVGVGTEMAINTTTNDDQAYPAVGVDGGSNFVAAWESTGQDGSGAGVYARLFEPSGVPRTGELQVNTYTAGHQWSPAVAVHRGGAFVVVWHDDSQDGSSQGVYAQRYDATGNRLGGEFRVNTEVTNQQWWPAIAMDADANFVVAWDSQAQDGSGYGIYAQRFDATGTPVGTEFRANTTTANDQRIPAVAMDHWGNFVVAWTSTGQDGSSSGVYAQRFDNTGARVGGELQINATTAGTQQSPDLATDGWGNYVIAWESENQDGNGYGIYARRLLATPLADGFERGDLWRWSEVLEVGDT